MKLTKEFKERFSRRNLFSARDAEKFLSGKKAGKGYAKLLLHNLTKRGEKYLKMAGRIARERTGRMMKTKRRMRT